MELVIIWMSPDIGGDLISHVPHEMMTEIIEEQEMYLSTFVGLMKSLR